MIGRCFTLSLKPHTCPCISWKAGANGHDALVVVIWLFRRCYMMTEEKLELIAMKMMSTHYTYTIYFRLERIQHCSIDGTPKKYAMSNLMDHGAYGSFGHPLMIWYDRNWLNFSCIQYQRERLPGIQSWRFLRIEILFCLTIYLRTCKEQRQWFYAKNGREIGFLHRFVSNWKPNRCSYSARHTHYFLYFYFQFFRPDEPRFHA